MDHGTDLALLAWSLDEHDVAGNGDALSRVARPAPIAEAPSVLVEILIDAEAPEIARLGAFGHVAAELTRGPPAEVCAAA